MSSCTPFEALHQQVITGKLTTFDRMIFKGYLTGFFGKGRFRNFLARQGILLKGSGRASTTDIPNDGFSCATQLRWDAVPGKCQGTEDPCYDDGDCGGATCTIPYDYRVYRFMMRPNNSWFEHYRFYVSGTLDGATGCFEDSGGYVCEYTEAGGPLDCPWAEPNWDTCPPISFSGFYVTTVAKNRLSRHRRTSRLGDSGLTRSKV